MPDQFGNLTAEDYFGTGSPYLTSQAQTARQKFAQQLLLEGASAAPVAHPLQALARTLQGGMGGYLLNREEDALRAQRLAERAAVYQAYGIAPTAATTPPVQPPAPTPPVTPTQTSLVGITSQGETGTQDLVKASANISPDTGGSKSYGFLGLNSGYGPSAGKGSAAQFASRYPSLGLTAAPGTREFDAQWDNAVKTMPDQLVGAQLDWHQTQILPTIAGGLKSAGVPDAIASDPRTLAFMADRAVQYGPGSTANHANRIAAAVQASDGTAEGFVNALSASDRANLPNDFRTYLSERPRDIRGLNNRITTRQDMALRVGEPTEAPAEPTTTPRRMAQGVVVPPPPAYVPSKSTLDMAMSPDPRIAALGRQRLSEERKAAEPDWQITPQGETGLFTLTDKKDPRRQFTLDSGQADEIARRLGIISAAKAGGEQTGKTQAQRGLLATPEETEKIRDDFRQLPSFKNVNTVGPVYNSMRDAASRDNRGSDLNLIYGLAKVLDPNSVVRESEQAIIQDIQRYPERLQSTILSFVTGSGRLSPQARAEIMTEAYSRAKAFENEYQTDREHFSGIAERRGIDPRDIMRSYQPVKPWVPPEKETPQTAPTQGWGKAQVVR